jgi:predicted metal-dependent peptidase
MERVSTADETTAAADLDMGKLLAARRVAVQACPYLATALYAMAIVPTYAVPTMGVDRYWRCYVSPSFVAANEVPDLAFVWLHEVCHLVRDHHGRADALWRRSERHALAPGTPALDPTRPQREQLRLNLAMDCEINDDLLPSLAAIDNTAGPRMPQDAVTPDTLRIDQCDLFEQYVRQLTPAALRGRQVWLDCGSGAHGGHADWEHGRDGANPLGPHEAAAIRIQVRDALNQGRGTAPAGWRRWAEGVTEPLQDWRTLLGAALRACIAAAGGAGDYTYRRPGRRTPALGGKVIMPSLRRPLPQVAIVIDTSGSVSAKDLGSALSEVTGISRTVGVHGNRISVYSCDAAVHTVQRITAAQDITLTGGGGTDLRQGIDRAATASPRPDVIVVLTDGDTPWPTAAPTARVIAGIFGSRPRCPTVPAWVETVYLR